MDLRSEQDAEQLRRIAMAQQVQIEQLLKVLAQKCRELEALKGNPEELQQTLKFVEDLTKKAQKAKETAQAQAAQAGELKKKAREKFGPTAQPELERQPRLLELDAADRICPSCGGELEPMKGQFETSEMIDVVDVSYKLVVVQQQKVLLQMRWLHRDGDRSRTGGRRWALLARLRHQGSGR